MTTPRRCGPSGGTVWPPEDVARLLELKAEGLGPTAIARVMQRTKRAVIGKLDRLKNGESSNQRRPGVRTTGDKSAGGRAATLAKKAKPNAKNNNPCGWGAINKAKRHATVANVADHGMRNRNPTGLTVTKLIGGKSRGHDKIPDLPVCKARISIAKLEHHHCRYIGYRPEHITIDTLLYCGAETLSGKSWCADHWAIVYQPPRPQKLDRLTYLAR